MRKFFLRWGAIYAGLAVTLGAFGAHSLKGILTTDQLDVFETGVRYQFYHAFALLVVGLLLYSRKTRFLPLAGWLFGFGVLLFSGSLYFLSIDEAINLSFSWLGPITPIGGFLLIGGWLFFFLSTFQSNERRYHKDQ